jgi:hypothetical protein
MIEIRSLDGAGGLVSFAKTVKILEGPAIIVTVSARLGRVERKSFILALKTVILIKIQRIPPIFNRKNYG